MGNNIATAKIKSPGISKEITNFLFEGGSSNSCNFSDNLNFSLVVSVIVAAIISSIVNF
jgi:hypothetical protein